MLTRKTKAKRAILAALARRGVKATPQGLSALVEAILRCDPEYFGDTDTLLLGLLAAGSYTIDVLENAGVNRRVLTRLTRSTAVGPRRWAPTLDGDPIEVGFGAASAGAQLLDIAAAERRPIDTADMLRVALSPEDAEVRLYPKASPGAFPFEQRKDTPANAPLLMALEERVAEMLLFIASQFSAPLKPSEMLRSRTHPLTEEEDWILDKEFGTLFRGMKTEELEFIIQAFNSWFVNRTLLTTPAKLCFQTVERCTSLLFAPTHFARSGGDLATLEAGLGLAKRFVPERDVPFMALFLHNERVHAGHFTYRDSLLVPDYGRSRRLDVQGVQLFSPRPVPLVSALALARFEQLLSAPRLSPIAIRQFLMSHPEFLLSLGYSTAAPHVCLSDPDGDHLLPDFILEIPGRGGIDILNLQSPSASLVDRDPYASLSRQLTRAIADLRRYSQFFENPANRKRFEATYGVTGFRPQVIVVIGRSAEFHSTEERANIEDQLGKVRLITYDDLVGYARSRAIEIPIAVDDGDDPLIDASSYRPTKSGLLLPSASALSHLPFPQQELTVTSSTPLLDYDVALSFAGEDRAVAKQIADSLTASGIKVFYDEYEQAALWGKDLYAHLSETYSKKARYCVMLISKHYADKLWTNHERRAAQERAFREREEYILPLRLDDTLIPGILSTTGYLDMRSLQVDDVVRMLRTKLGK